MSSNTKFFVVVFTEQTRDEGNKIELYATSQASYIEGLIEELQEEVDTDEYILVEDQSTYKRYVDEYNENSIIIYYQELEVRT